MKRRAIWTWTALAVAVAACSKTQPADEKKAELPAATAAPAEAAPAPPNPVAESQRLFASRCAVCHGTSGKGDGPGAVALTPKPRDYTDAEWQKTVTDEQIRNTILLGGAAVGKSAAMPGNPDLQSKPEVLDALVKHVRSFQK